MFCYQCRYCKVTFEQWGKLVSHKRDEHREEFEALRTAYLLQQQGSARTKFLQLELERGSLNGPGKATPLILTNPLRTLQKAEKMNQLLPQKLEQSSSKEVEFENQEITIRIPLSSASSSSTMSYQNGGSYRHVSNNEFKPSHPSHPPGKLGNLNWSPSCLGCPHQQSKIKAVLCHQMNDDDEIELCVIPSTGFQISVTKHPLKRPLIYNNVTNHHHHNHHASFSVTPSATGKSSPPPQSGNGSQIVIGETEELQVTFSANGGSSKAKTTPAPVNGTRRSEEEVPTRTSSIQLELLRNRGESLKRLHSQLQLQLQQRNHGFKIPPHSLRSKDAGVLVNNCSKRVKMTNEGGRSSLTENSSTTTGYALRFNNNLTRASPRKSK